MTSIKAAVGSLRDRELRLSTKDTAELRASAHAGQVEPHVVDHGPGLPKGATGTLFAPFQRPGDRDATPGVGLGLSVAKGFTEAMGGTIRAEDTPVAA